MKAEQLVLVRCVDANRFDERLASVLLFLFLLARGHVDLIGGLVIAVAEAIHQLTTGRAEHIQVGAFGAEQVPDKSIFKS